MREIIALVDKRFGIGHRSKLLTNFDKPLWT